MWLYSPSAAGRSARSTHELQLCPAKSSRLGTRRSRAAIAATARSRTAITAADARPPRRRRRAAPSPPPSDRGHASLSPYLASSRFAQAQLGLLPPPPLTPAQLSGKCSYGEVVMPTELAQGSLPKCKIACAEGEIKASGYPLPTPLHTSFVPLVHSSKFTAHTRAPHLSLPKIPL